MLEIEARRDASDIYLWRNRFGISYIDAMQAFTDWLFTLGLYRGVKMEPPKGLVCCELDHDGALYETFQTSINEKHELSEWLLNDCEGPWTIRMKRPLNECKAYLAFARLADATIFRFKMS